MDKFYKLFEDQVAAKEAFILTIGVLTLIAALLLVLVLAYGLILDMIIILMITMVLGAFFLYVYAWKKEERKEKTTAPIGVTKGGGGYLAPRDGVDVIPPLGTISMSSGATTDRARYIDPMLLEHIDLGIEIP